MSCDVCTYVRGNARGCSIVIANYIYTYTIINAPQFWLLMKSLRVKFWGQAKPWNSWKLDPSKFSIYMVACTYVF